MICFLLFLLSCATRDRNAVIGTFAVCTALIILFRKMGEADPRQLEIRLRGLSTYRERRLRAEAVVGSPVRRHDRKILG